MAKLHYETVSPLLRKTLNDIMANSIFDPFYLVGGTSLSLRLGHRKSVDIDPTCLKNKEWELIKLDFVEQMQSEFS